MEPSNFLYPNAMVYDIEVVKAIPSRKEARIEGIEYCGGWDSHADMGISVIGAYDFATGRSRVFLADNMQEFAELARNRWPLVSYNGLRFDNKVIKETLGWGAGELAWFDGRCYDLLAAIIAAAGTFAGYTLDAVCKATLGPTFAKTGHGALAPVLWQQKQYGAVIDYCLNDVAITADLFRFAVDTGRITDPVKGGYLALGMPKRPLDDAAPITDAGRTGVVRM